MQLTDRFFVFAEQQLSELCKAMELRHLALYLSAKGQDQEPALELVRQWPLDGLQLPAADRDPELRLPAGERRWYPLQDGPLILGALRAELSPEQRWTQALDGQLRMVAGSISHALSRDLECLRLRRDVVQQQEQLRMLVHQLRNPLAALRTYAQLLLRRLEPDSRHRELVEGMLGEQRQLDRYISAIEGIGQEALPGTTDSASPLLLPPGLSPASSSVQDLLKPLVDRAAATATLQGRPWQGPNQWPAWTNQPTQFDGAAILEIVANLLENAFRYSPTGCAIGLILLEAGLCVWDSGPAIALDERDTIFQQGVRGSTGQDRPGTGLGLALARSLAERHGGQLTLSVQPSLISPSLPTSGNAFQLSWPKQSQPDTTVSTPQ
ncbi:MAG: two-component sensor histidine kinase [Cyanobium sp. NAT70]|nr:two-component sensor histidine kinase [Cyanobium sp. NAT70]|tara:strand:+ start:6077 stop:7219 length:1143 start_codon:yes stop_codon:yes gene_type:complete